MKSLFSAFSLSGAGLCFAEDHAFLPPMNSLLLFRTAAVRKSGISKRTASSLAPGALVVTDSATKRLRTLLKDNQRYLRITVKGGGCSGFEYVFGLDETKLQPDDLILENEGAKVVIDPISLEKMEGATIDYQNVIERQKFLVLKNPKATSNCSCKFSFAIE